MRSLFLVIIGALLLSIKQVISFHVVPPPELFHSLPHAIDHLAPVFSPSTVLKDVTSGLFGSYQNALQTDALRTQIVTGVSLAVMGDAIAQKAGSNNEYNTKRAVSFATFDASYRVVQHYLYPPMIALCHGDFLGSLIPNPTIAAALEQSLFSQLLIIPTLYYPTFYAITGFVQGLSLEETVERARTAFWPLMLRNWAFWIPVQALVFGSVHDEAQQIPFLISAGLVWTVILSLAAGQATPMVKENVLLASTETVGVADGLNEQESQRFAFQSATPAAGPSASASSSQADLNA